MLGMRLFGLYAKDRAYVQYTTTPAVGFDSVVTGSGIEVLDYLAYSPTTSPDGYPNSIDNSGVPTIDSGGDASRQSFHVDMYSIRGRGWTGDVTDTVNNSAPDLLGGGSILVLFMDLNTPIVPIDFGALATDVEGDPISVTFTDALPTGLLQVGNTVSGTPTVQAITAITTNWSDSLGSSTPAQVIFVVGKVPVPSVVGINIEGVDDAIFGAYLVPDIRYEHSDTIPENFVISQLPGFGAFADPNSNVEVVVSTGPDEDVVIIETGTIRFDPLEGGTKNLGATGSVRSVHPQRPTGYTGTTYATPQKTPQVAIPATIDQSPNRVRKGKQ